MNSSNESQEIHRESISSPGLLGNFSPDTNSQRQSTATPPPRHVLNHTFSSNSSYNLQSFSPKQANSHVQSQYRPMESGHNNGSRRATQDTIQPSSPARQADAELAGAYSEETVLRNLLDMDCGMPLLLDRVKQTTISCKETAGFMRKRAMIEEEYGKAMIKLARSTMEAYGQSDGRAGSFVPAWSSFLRTHETIGDNRIRFSNKLSEMSEDLGNVVKEVDKSRKTHKDIGLRAERNLQEHETTAEKAKGRFDSYAEELEKVLVCKEGESSVSSNGGITSSASSSAVKNVGKVVKSGRGLFRAKGASQMIKQEEDARARTVAASDVYKKHITEAEALRKDYFESQLPRILRGLKECTDELDLGTQYHLSRYAMLFENIILTDASALAPIQDEEGQGLRAIIHGIDNRRDFKNYMQNYILAAHHSRPPRRVGPTVDESHTFQPSSTRSSAMSPQSHLQPSRSALNFNTSSASPLSPAKSPVMLAPNPNATFGVHLAYQMERDDIEVPLIVTKCVEAIEKRGMDQQGIYRLSGTTSQVQRLKTSFDSDMDDVDLETNEAAFDINVVASVLKLWFRELPEPLIPNGSYQSFVEAAKIEVERTRHIRLHEHVNALPDPNYATLRYFFGHLDKVQAMEEENAMSVSNLAIVFGPTLFGGPQVAPGDVAGGNSALEDMKWQCQAVQTILEHYQEIFVE